MSRSAFVTAAAIALAGPALAGGVAETAVAPVPVPAPVPTPGTDWTGGYVGLQYDIANGEFREQRGGGLVVVEPGLQPFPETPVATGFGVTAQEHSSRSRDFDGHLYGVFGGYRYDFGQLVVGGELDYMVGEFEFDVAALDSESEWTFDVDRLIRLGGEVGFDAGRALIYGTAGFADIELSDGGESVGSDGYFYGIGADFLLTERVTIGAEVLQHDFSDFDGEGDGIEMEFLTVGINAAIRF